MATHSKLVNTRGVSEDSATGLIHVKDKLHALVQYSLDSGCGQNFRSMQHMKT